MTKEISVIIVNWNTADVLKDCLDSIKNNIFFNRLALYVVDNASSDFDQKKFKKEYPWVNFSVNKKNVGFAKANNQILKKVNTKYIFLLNPDTLVLENTVKPLYDFLENNLSAACCGPQMLNIDKSKQKGFYRKFPSLIQTLLYYTDLHRLAEKNSFLVNRFWEVETNKETAVEVDQIPGACFFVRTSLIKKLGCFDERFVFWFEDVDLCFRVKKLGYGVYLVPKSQIVHIGGVSWAKWSDVAARETRFNKGLLLFVQKNYGVLSATFTQLILFASMFFMVISRGLMQLFDYKSDRQKFIKIKMNVIWNMMTNNLTLPV